MQLGQQVSPGSPQCVHADGHGDIQRGPHLIMEEGLIRTSNTVQLPVTRIKPCLARSCRVSRRIFFNIQGPNLTPKIDNACISEKPWPVPARAAFAPRWAPAPRNECSPPETGCATRCEPPQAEVLRTSQRQRQTGAASPRPEGSGLGVALPRGGGGGLWGGVRGSQGGVHPRRIFRFQPADFPADFFGGFFLCILRPKQIDRKIHRKIHRSVESSCFRNPLALRHQKFTGLPLQGEQIQLLCVRVWDRHFSGWEFPGKDSRFNWTSEPQNPYTKNRCGMAMHGVPCSMSY